LIEAEVDVGMFLEGYSTELGGIGNNYQELQLIFSPSSYPTATHEGRNVWMTSTWDGMDGTPVTADTTLFNDIQLGVPPLGNPLNYEQKMLKCRGLILGGQTRDLYLFFRMVSGYNQPPDNIASYKVQVSGILKIYRA